MKSFYAAHPPPQPPADDSGEAEYRQSCRAYEASLLAQLLGFNSSDQWADAVDSLTPGMQLPTLPLPTKAPNTRSKKKKKNRSKTHLIDTQLRRRRRRSSGGDSDESGNSDHDSDEDSDSGDEAAGVEHKADQPSRGHHDGAPPPKADVLLLDDGPCVIHPVLSVALFATAIGTPHMGEALLEAMHAAASKAAEPPKHKSGKKQRKQRPKEVQKEKRRMKKSENALEDIANTMKAIGLHSEAKEDKHVRWEEETR